MNPRNFLTEQAPRLCNLSEAPALERIAPPSLRTADLVEEGETIILLLRPSVLYIPLGSLGALMTIGLLTLALALVALKFPDIGWREGEAYAFGAILAALRLLWQGLEWWSRIYILTDRRIIRRMGVIRMMVYETTLRQIQHASVFRTLRERLCGLGDIGFATRGNRATRGERGKQGNRGSRGGNTFEVFWVMIPHPYRHHRIIVEAIKRYGRG